MTNALLGILVVLATAFALRQAAAVTLPIALAIFLIALHWPLQRRLDRFMPRGLAMVLSTAAFLAVCTGFVWALLESADEVRDRAGGYQERLRATAADLQAWLAERGLSVSGAGGGATDMLASAARALSRVTFDFVAGFLLVVAFLSLGLLEVRSFAEKLRKSVSSDRGERHWSALLGRIGSSSSDTS